MDEQEIISETEKHNAKVPVMVSLLTQNGWKFLVEEINKLIDDNKELLVYADPADIAGKQGFIKGLRAVLWTANEMATEIKNDDNSTQTIAQH